MADPPGWTRRGPWEDTFTAARAKLAYAWADFLLAWSDALFRSAMNLVGTWERPPGGGCRDCGGVWGDHTDDCPFTQRLEERRDDPT